MTFEQFIHDSHIKIPAIQRDYVQGRGYTIEERDKREAFVNKLLDSISTKNDLKCHLEFIYGTKDESKDYFIPLDGQQRLTTLFILHWVIWQKSSIENKQENYPLEAIENFSYETRISSTNFCKNLITKEIIRDSADCSLKESIKKQPWFSEEWKLDPTINAILSMIDCIEEKLDGNESYDVNSMLDNLRSPNYSSVTFDELNMSDYHLSDSLYINMNARGKQLTSFENWKSDFIGALEDKDCFGNDEYENGEEDRKQDYKTFEDYFTYSIEHQWTDLFWSYLMKEYKTLDVKDQEKKYPAIDDMFMNLFNLFCSYAYYKEGNATKSFSELNAQERKAIYLKKEFVTFLMQSLDSLTRIKINNFFDDLFYISDHVLPESNNQNKGKLRLFRTENTDLLHICNGKGANMEIMDQLLFIALLKYCNKYHIEKVDDNVRLYMREIRNYLESVIQNLRSRTLVSLNLRVENFPDYDKKFDEIIEKNDFADKTEKECQIEDCSWLCGHTEALKNAIDAFGMVDTYNALKVFCDKNLNDLQRVRLLVACGYTGAMLGNCMEGRERRFFGGGDKWNVVFISDAKNVRDVFEKITSKIKSGESVSNIINYENDEFKDKEKIKMRFAYYMLKYDHFAEATNNPYHYATRGELDDVDIIALGSYSSNPGTAYHTDPLACAVSHELRDSTVQLSLYKQYTGKCSLNIVKDKVNWETLYSIKSRVDGWHEVDCDGNLTDTIYSGEDLVQVGMDVISKKYHELFP